MIAELALAVAVVGVGLAWSATRRTARASVRAVVESLINDGTLQVVVREIAPALLACKACDGTGKRTPGTDLEPSGGLSDDAAEIEALQLRLAASQGICCACTGTGQVRTT